MKYVVFEKIKRRAGVWPSRAKVKESVREIIVCGLPSFKASRISRGLIKPRAAVVGRRRGQTHGNYEARRDSRNGREVILLDLARGGGNKPSIIVAPCFPSVCR